MEQQTVALAAKGNEAAIASLYEEFSGHAYYICLRYLRNPEDASDATQDTFMTALSRLGQLKDYKRFPQWLSRIAANTCLNKIKRKSPVLFTDFEAKSGVPVEVTIEDNTRENMPEWVCEKQDLRDTLATLVDKLPDAQRIAVMYYYYHQYSVDEISRLTNCSSNTIKSRLYMGRARLRTELDKLKIGDERCAFLPISALIAIMGYNSFEFYAPTAVSTALANTIPSISAAIQAASLAAAKGTAVAATSNAATTAAKGMAIAKGATAAKAATSTAAASASAASASAAASGAAAVGGAIATKVIAIGLSATLLVGAGTAAVVAVTKKDAGLQAFQSNTSVPAIQEQHTGISTSEPDNTASELDSPLIPLNIEWDTVEDDYFKYTIQDGVAIIDEYNGQVKNLRIPSEFDGYPVASLGSGSFEENTSLTCVEIPPSVNRIEDFAFMNCTSLENVIIPNSVTYIGGMSFRGCLSLTSVSIPDGVTEIEPYSFTDCSSLSSVSVGKGIKRIGDCAFNGCKSLTSVTLPNSLQWIGEYAFFRCSSLSRVFCECEGMEEPYYGGYRFSECADNFTIFYPSIYASSWSPNGETKWSGYPIEPYDYSADSTVTEVTVSQAPSNSPIPTLRDGRWDFYFDESTDVIESNGNYYIQISSGTGSYVVQFHPDLRIRDNNYAFYEWFSDEDNLRFSVNHDVNINNPDTPAGSIVVSDLQYYIEMCREEVDYYYGFRGTMTIENGLVVSMLNNYME